ncbi:MAG TPA: NAD(P)/FAD-dependent oxidoreductase [Terriglobales bacterium]|jgi:phytoene dehydrogenase-like protein|nr:NAD(P)/FAD-dependent oxidoreductase [Terriglobales bacterium]
MPATQRRAVVIGSGPNGLAAAIVLAQAGLQVDVYEAESLPGGGARTMPLTLPGFMHDFGSAVHPMAVASPFFTSLPLEKFGLEWIQPSAPVAHPLDDGTAVILERDLKTAEAALGEDGKQWRRFVGSFAEHWWELAPEVLRPVSLFPRHPFLLAHLGLLGFPSASSIANVWFRSARTKAMFAGLAGHSMVSLEEPLTSAFGIMFAATAHAVGWPIPRGGSQSITSALSGYFASLGGTLHLSSRVENLGDLGKFDVALCDVTPRQLLRIAGDRLSASYKRSLERYRYGPGVFKADYALSAPVPWKAAECRRSVTVHLGGTLEEIVASEDAMRHGRHAERPFMLAAQPTLFDPTRAPEGRHILWTYCHVPNGSDVDMLPRMEAQLERFAPGFRDCVLERHILCPKTLEAMNANLVGGDIGGGLMNLRQFLFRPTMRHYATSARDIYICSSSTPPGGGVHGMCGYNAAKLALKGL